MQEIINFRFLVAVNLILIVGIIVVASWVFHTTQLQITNNLRSNIATQHDTLLSLADLTDRNGGDETVNSIVIDCASRSEFESLLVSLGTLNQRELLTTQQLFASCGDFFAVRKAFMVSRLEREFQVLDAYVEMLTTVEEDSRLVSLTKKWNMLVNREKDRSDMLAEQVLLQEEIITELIKGSNINATSIKNRQARAQDVAEQLQVTDQQIDLLRSEISKFDV